MDLEGLIVRLIQHQVDFVIVGGFAAIAHGSTLMTQDIDVCCSFSLENLLAIQSALRDVHPVHRMTPKRLPLILTEESCKGLKNLYLNTDLGQIDCLSSITGVGDYSVVQTRSVEVELNAGKCKILALDALIEAKMTLGRAKDKNVALQLKAIQERQKRP